MIFSDWTKESSRILTLELILYERRGEDQSCDLGLLVTIYLVRPNQLKASYHATYETMERASSYTTIHSSCNRDQSLEFSVCHLHKSHFKPDFDLDLARISQFVKNERCRVIP